VDEEKESKETDDSADEVKESYDSADIRLL
jgi:hypothetical protein